MPRGVNLQKSIIRYLIIKFGPESLFIFIFFSIKMTQFNPKEIISRTKMRLDKAFNKH